MKTIDTRTGDISVDSPDNGGSGNTTAVIVTLLSVAAVAFWLWEKQKQNGGSERT